MSGWIGDNGDPDDWLGFFFPKYDANSARWSYNNPAVFALLNKAKVENSQAKRAQMYAQAMTLVSHEVAGRRGGGALTSVCAPVGISSGRRAASGTRSGLARGPPRQFRA